MPGGVGSIPGGDVVGAGEVSGEVPDIGDSPALGAAVAAQFAGQMSAIHSQVFRIPIQAHAKLPPTGGSPGVITPGVQTMIAQADEPPPDEFFLPGEDEPALTPEAEGQREIIENETEAIKRHFLAGARFRARKAAEIFEKGGGFEQANRDFDKITRGWSLPVIDKGGGLRTATLPNGGTVGVRPSSSQRLPTIQIDTPGHPRIKIRY